MTHTYQVTGMTCAGCQHKVQTLLQAVPGVSNVAIDLAKGEAAITMERHLPTATLQAALKDYPKYQLSGEHQMPAPANPEEEDTRPWLETYKPILLIFFYITLVSAIAAASGEGFNWMLGMRVFMSGFFLTFSFFKLLDLAGFADSYSTYDIIAKKFRGWGYAYAFVELALGIAYAVNFNPVVTNLVTLVVMSLSIIGVLQSVLNKRKIQCACLGAVFNLPMSTVTIIEDALMIAMSAVMLFSIL